MIWRWLMAWLVWLATDPQAVDLERPRAAAAVAAASASLAKDRPAPAPPAPPPPPGPAKCCRDCGGRGTILQPDGHRTRCPCPDSCACRKAAAARCADGACFLP